ncbi:MAG: hypothetical protein NVSMB51_05620 [Solirubrobacteraceae bacterium]
MLLALGACGIMGLFLLCEVSAPRLGPWLARKRAGLRRAPTGVIAYDPGRERRAEQRARVLLRSCVGEEDWAMYADLGVLRVWGRCAHDPQDSELAAGAGAPYAYLIYAHKPLVSYIPQTGRLLSEYCVEFPDFERPYGSARLPDSDDVLAKWMALTGDERRLIASANMHLPGRQIDPDAVRRDLWRIGRWEQARMARGGAVAAP